MNNTLNNFKDHLSQRLEDLNSGESGEWVSSASEYEQMILQGLEHNYDDLEDYINMQKALTNIQGLIQDNIKQILKITKQIP